MDLRSNAPEDRRAHGSPSDAPGRRWPAVLDGGVDVVFDCRASALSIDPRSAPAARRGTLVLCGRSGRHEIEWSLIWARELTVPRAASYGREPDAANLRTIREW